MAISEQHVGRAYPPTAPYEVSAAKIGEFARALGDDNPAYAGEAPVAPPTFVAVIAAAAWDSLFGDAELDLALRRVVHADQRFDYVRPLRAGDRVSAVLTIDKVRVRGEVDIIGVSVKVATIDGEPVCGASSTFYHSHDSAGAASGATR
jgi:acyl dehydratase